MGKYEKYIENQRLKKYQYCFANISSTKTWIFMKVYVVVNYYLVSLSFKFREDLSINVSARVVKARAFTTCARTFMHGSSLITFQHFLIPSTPIIFYFFLHLAMHLLL